MADFEEREPRASYSLPSSLHICSFTGCSKTFSRPARLKIHLRSHTGERPFCCEEDGCTKQYARAAHLKRHHEKSHQKQPSPTKIRCKEDNCKELFSSYNNLKKHIIRIHESRPYKCTYTGCGKAFRKHQHLKVHEFDHTHINPFVCPVEGCGMSFRFPSVLKRHSKVHEGYPCDVKGCSEVMKTWTLLIKHKHLHHSKVFTCKECGSIFRKSNIYHQHMKTHSPERLLFSCPRDGCERSYLDKRNLMAHIRSFHDGQKFTCEQCQKQFSAKQKLHQHKKTHDPLYCKPKPKVRLNTHRKKSKLEKLTGYKRETCVGELSETVMVEDRNSLEKSSYSDSCHSSQESLLAMDSSNLGSHVTVKDNGTYEEDMIVTGSPVDLCRGGSGPSHTQSSSESSTAGDMDSLAGPSKISSVPNSVVCSPQESHQVQHKCR